MKSVLITGASTGFGRLAAIELAAKGWLVFASMRNLAKATALTESALSSDRGGRIVPVELDVTSPDSIASAIETVLRQTGGTLDVLLNNAGYSIMGAFEDYSDAQCRQQMDTNFFGALGVTRAVLPAMRKTRSGRIIIVTSNAVNSPHPFLSLYAASKWALEGWAEGLAMELAPFGIEVAVLQPGAHRTEFAGNVEFVQAEESAYAPLIQAAMPGISNLDRWGRDPARGAASLVEAICNDGTPFRQQIGEDSQIFAALKGAAPYEVRALALRAIVGLPGPGALVGASGSPSSADETPVAEEVMQIVMNAAGKDPELTSTLRRTFLDR